MNRQNISEIIRKIFISINRINKQAKPRGGPRATATSKMECFVIIVNGFQPLTIITKHSILNVAAALDPPLKPAKNYLIFDFSIKGW